MGSYSWCSVSLIFGSRRMRQLYSAFKLRHKDTQRTSERGRGRQWALVSFICRYEKRGPIQAHHLNITVAASSLISSVVIGVVAGESFSSLSLSRPLAQYPRDFPLQEIHRQYGLPTNVSYPSRTFIYLLYVSNYILAFSSDKIQTRRRKFEQIACRASKYKGMRSGDLPFYLRCPEQRRDCVSCESLR